MVTKFKAFYQHTIQSDIVLKQEYWFNDRSLIDDYIHTYAQLNLNCGLAWNLAIEWIITSKIKQWNLLLIHADILLLNVAHQVDLIPITLHVTS